MVHFIAVKPGYRSVDFALPGEGNELKARNYVVQLGVHAAQNRAEDGKVTQWRLTVSE
jgi:hypothetical protein